MRNGVQGFRIPNSAWDLIDHDSHDGWMRRYLDAQGYTNGLETRMRNALDPIRESLSETLAAFYGPPSG